MNSTLKAIASMALGLALVLTLSVEASAQGNPCNPCGAKSFVVNDPMNRNTVTFKSTVPLEDIVGISNQVVGKLFFDPMKPAAGGSGMLRVPVASLDTGIPLRDEHLAGPDWLDAGGSPDISFTIVEVKNVKPLKVTDAAKTFDVVAVGDFSLKGKTRRISVPARITWLKESDATKKRQPGDLLAIRTTFDVALADFGITGPAGMDIIGSKVGATVSVELSVVASSAGGDMAGNPCGGKQAMNPCNPCGGKKAMNPCNPCGGKHKAGMAGNPCGEPKP